MFATKIIASMAFLLVASNAAVMDFYDDPNCQQYSYTRNVYDESCAPTGGFQSYRITTAGGSTQVITTFGRNACAGDATSCVDSSSVGTCYQAINSYGGSNAVASGPGCGVV